MVGIVHGKMVSKELGLFYELVDHKYRRPKHGGQNCWWYPKLCELTDKLGTEPVTVSKALRHSTENALAREQSVFPSDESQPKQVDDDDEKGPRVYRSWTFQRFDYQ